MADKNMLSLDNPVMRDFIFYSTVVIFKMMMMSLLTARVRISNKVFANAEDAVGTKDKKAVFGYEPVERVRRNHLNDIENVIPFVLIGVLYVLTNPSPSTARLLFRLFVGSRILHTVAYQVPLPQPSRALSFFVGLIVTVIMGVNCIMTTL